MKHKAMRDGEQRINASVPPTWAGAVGLVLVVPAVVRSVTKPSFGNAAIVAAFEITSGTRVIVCKFKSSKRKMWANNLHNNKSKPISTTNRSFIVFAWKKHIFIMLYCTWRQGVSKVLLSFLLKALLPLLPVWPFSALLREKKCSYCEQPVYSFKMEFYKVQNSPYLYLLIN